MQLPISLQTHPELRRCLEQARQTQSRIGADGALSQHDLVQPVQRNSETLRSVDLSDAKGFQELLEQHLARRDGGTSLSGFLVFHDDFLRIPALDWCLITRSRRDYFLNPTKYRPAFTRTG